MKSLGYVRYSLVVQNPRKKSLVKDRGLHFGEIFEPIFY